MKKIIGIFTHGKNTNIINRISDLNLESSSKLLEIILDNEMPKDSIKEKVIEMLSSNERTQALFLEVVQKNSSHDIAKEMVNINKLIYSAAAKFFHISPVRLEKNTEKLAMICTECITELLNSARNLNSKKHAKVSCNKILQLCRNADDLYNQGIGDMFHFFKNSIDVIKLREIYNSIHLICNKCNDTAILILKH